MTRPNRPHSGARIALAHDWIVGGRGGEWVLDRLARLFGPTRIYTLVYDGRPPTEAIAACEIVTSPLQRVPGARGRLRRVALPLLPWAVGRLEVEPCDLLISSSSAVMKSIRPPLGTPHLCYCHSPPRYIWDQAGDYAYGAGGAGRRLGLALIRHPFQRWDRSTAAGVTRFLANSHHTAGRIARWYGREAAVVPPPVRTDFYCPDPRVARESWLLVVSALEPYKRVDLAIAAANLRRMGAQGGGRRNTAASVVPPSRAVGRAARTSPGRRASEPLSPRGGASLSAAGGLRDRGRRGAGDGLSRRGLRRGRRPRDGERGVRRVLPGADAGSDHRHRRSTPPAVDRSGSLPSKCSSLRAGALRSVNTPARVATVERGLTGGPSEDSPPGLRSEPASAARGPLFAVLLVGVEHWPVDQPFYGVHLPQQAGGVNLADVHAVI